MRFAPVALVSIALAARQALAEIVLTAPTGSTVCNGGQTCNVNWSAGPNPPTLQAAGACSFGVFVGSQFQQTLIQPINSAVNVATTGGIVFTVDPAAGQDSSSYFIRVQCGIPDPTTPTEPYLAFSHMFSLALMTGQFNASVVAQINASNTTSAAGLPTTPTPTPTPTPAPSSSSSIRSSSTGSTSTSPSAKPSQSGAAAVNYAGNAVWLAIPALAFMLM